MDRELWGTFIRWDGSDKIGEAHNGNTLKRSQPEEMLVAGGNKIRFSGHRTFENSVIRHSFEYRDLAHRPDNRCRPTEDLQHSSDVFFGLVELLAKNPSGLGEDWNRCVEIDRPTMRSRSACSP